MGRTLQKTAVSTNIKERLDFSCALFSPDGGLVANAPYVLYLVIRSDRYRTDSITVMSLCISAVCSLLSSINTSIGKAGYRTVMSLSATTLLVVERIW